MNTIYACLYNVYCTHIVLYMYKFIQDLCNPKYTHIFTIFSTVLKSSDFIWGIL